MENKIDIDTNNMEMPDILKKIINQLSIQEHQKRLNEKLEKGWKYGHEYNEKHKTDPLLKPYEDLDLKAREQLDKEIEKSIYKLLSKPDREIEKIDEEIEKIKIQKFSFFKKTYFWFAFCIEIVLAIIPILCGRIYKNQVTQNIVYENYEVNINSYDWFPPTFYYISFLLIFVTMCFIFWTTYIQIKHQIKQNKKENNIYIDYLRSLMEKKIILLQRKKQTGTQDSD